MNTKILAEIGFTPGEIKVYLALVELGESTIGPISKKSRVTPSKTYPILEKLKEKGLVSHVIKSGTKYFNILNPERILNFLDDKKKRIDQQKKDIKEFIPQIRSKHKKTDQYATVYESFNGIKTLYDEILDYLSANKENFIAFSMREEYKKKQMNLFFRNYNVKRAKLGIKIKLIGLAHQRSFLERENKDYLNIETRYVDHAVPAGVIIYGDNVATLLWYDVPTAFVIHSRQNAHAYKKFFNDMWKIAKK
jgi:sugar-specific transcriptional regulator TrmB